MKKLISLIAITLASLPVIAEQDLVAKLDADNDGRISIEEAAKDADLASLFSELDTNNDSYLTPEELTKK